MCAPEGNSEFCFPESLNVSRESQCFPRVSMFPETKSRETLRLGGRKINNTYTIIAYCISRYHDNKSKIL